MTTIIIIILSLLSLTFFLLYKKEKRDHSETKREMFFQEGIRKVMREEIDDLNRELHGGNDFRREEV